MSPYNLSPKAVERWAPLLDEIRAQGNVAVRLFSLEPLKVAYALREAILAAKKHEIEPYASMAYSFSPKPDENLVIARPLSRVSTPSVRIEGLEVPSEFIFAEVRTPYDLVDVAGTVDAELMSFPNFDGDVESLTTWAEAKGFTIVTPSPLVLRRT